MGWARVLTGTLVLPYNRESLKSYHHERNDRKENSWSQTPRRSKQQCTSQYNDDSSFLERVEKPFIDELVYFLVVFSHASGMEMN